MALCSQLNRNRGTFVGFCWILLSCSVIEFSVSVAKHLSVISSMLMLLKEFVEVRSKESNVTAVLCCLRLVIFSSEVEKFLFSSGATAPAALEPLLEGGSYMSGWAVHLINMHFS